MNEKKVFSWILFGVIVVLLVAIGFLNYQKLTNSNRVDFVIVRVLDGDGHPVVGIVVTMQRTKAKKDSEQSWVVAITNQDGIAQYLDMPTDQYDIRLPGITCMNKTMGMTVELPKYSRKANLYLNLDHNCTHRQ